MNAGSDVKVKREGFRGSAHEFQAHGLVPGMLNFAAIDSF